VKDSPHRLEAIRLLKEAGAVLERTNKHPVWKLPSGKIHTMASTPSDSVHGDLNNLNDLKKLLASEPKQTKRLKPAYTILHGNTVYQMLRPEYERVLKKVCSPGHFDYREHILNEEVSVKYVAAEDNITNWNPEDFRDALKLFELESKPDFPGQTVLQPVYAASTSARLPWRPITEEEMQTVLLFEEEEAAKSWWRKAVESAYAKMKWRIRWIVNRIKSLRRLAT